MKELLTLAAITAAMALVAGSGMASNLTLNISGTAEIQGTNGVYEGTLKTLSFNEKSVYGIISNAVAHVSAYGTNLTLTGLPADGYIAFEPSASDGNVTGLFYVTNKTGFYLPLSGLNTNVFNTNDITYYSFIELDTILTRGDTNGVDVNDWGYYQFHVEFPTTSDFNSIASYTLSKTGTGSDKSVSKAILYIHDNPFAYGNPANNQNPYYNNDQYPFYPLPFNNYSALEIGGILTADLSIKTNSVTGGTLTLPGTGNFYYQGTYSGVVSSGKAILTIVK